MRLVGINIKRMREIRKMSLREFAKRLKVSASFLSQIETGKASPSISTLKDIADQLNTTIGRLFGEEPGAHPDPLMRSSQMQPTRLSSDGIRMTLLTSPDNNKQMEPLLFKLAKGAVSGETQYKHYGQEFVLVLKGSLEITLNDMRYTLNKGDSLYFNSSTPHQFRNADKGETEAIWVITPPTF
jgi:transcriptional regulator with XRE-family HTH domain